MVEGHAVCYMCSEISYVNAILYVVEEMAEYVEETNSVSNMSITSHLSFMNLKFKK